MQSDALIHINYGREALSCRARIGRHRHRHPYVAVILAGSYLEAGDCGRRRVSAGDVLVHEPFETHLNEIAAGGAEVLNLPLPAGVRLPAAARVRDPDFLVRLCERSPRDAAEALGFDMSEGPAPLEDWPDLLAAECREAGSIRLGEWARRHGLAAATVSRGFARVYGVSPARYRIEARSRRAWQAITATSESLASIAAESGFADQAHMTRSVARMTGRPPGGWRRSN
jgi:AraC-like DNA-binding protein